MNVDELFLFTLDDLERRIDLGQPEYDALMGAWLLRKILLDGERSLLRLVAQPRGLDPVFRLKDIQPEESVQLWSPPGNFVPDGTTAVLELTQPAFLKHLAVITALGTRRFTVREVIHDIANKEGAVHMRSAWDRAKIERARAAGWTPEVLESGPPEEVAFTVFSEGRVYGPDWQYSAGASAIREIGLVVLNDLSELRELVRAETWPDDYPEELKGLGGVGVVRRDDGAIEFRDRPGEIVAVYFPDGRWEYADQST